MKRIILVCLISLNLLGAAESKLSSHIADYYKGTELYKKILDEIELLFNAVNKGDIETVKYLFGKPPLVMHAEHLKEAKDVDGNTPLFIAASKNDLTMFAYLRERIWDLDAKNGQSGKTALHAALENMSKFKNHNPVELHNARMIVEILIKNRIRTYIKDNDGVHQLRLAGEIYRKTGFSEPYRLIRAAAIERARDSVSGLITDQDMLDDKSNEQGIADWLHKWPELHDFMDYFLHESIKENLYQMVEYFLSHGANVNAIGIRGTPLHEALRKIINNDYGYKDRVKECEKTIKIIERLLKAGADLDGIKFKVQELVFFGPPKFKYLTAFEYAQENLGRQNKVLKLFINEAKKRVECMLGAVNIPEGVTQIITDYSFGEPEDSEKQA